MFVEKSKKTTLLSISSIVLVAMLCFGMAAVMYSDDSDAVDGEYTVTFNGNGGTSVSATLTGTDITLPNATRDSTDKCTFTMLGWATTYNATEATYTVGSTYTATSDITLYAIWSATATGTSVDNDLGQKYSYSIQFVFSGADAESIFWSFGDGSTSTEWNPQHTYASNGTFYVIQTVYNSYNGGSSSTAVYKIVILGFPVIGFHSNGGSSVASIQQTAYGVVATEPTQPTKENCSFTGWYTDADCTTAYDWTSVVRSSMVLYAGWSEDIYYTVTFNVNGGSSTVSSQNILSGEKVTLPSYTGTKTGCTFGGWSCNGTTYSAGQTVTVTSAMTFTAVWTAEDTPSPEEPGNNYWWIALFLLVFAVLLIAMFLKVVL